MKNTAETEMDMQKAKVKTPDTIEELTEYINSLVEMKHDYGTCVYAMSMAAEAAFRFVSGKLGVTGFQASCADLDFLRRVRLLDCPFMIIKAEKLLYPQYDIEADLRETIKEWAPWAAEKAKKNLLEINGRERPAVIEHWKRIAALEAEDENS